jgi:HSP20 family molecular chaperone IbpA
VSGWEREIDRLFDDFRRHLAWPRLWPGALEPTEITTPALDVYENDDEVVVKAEIPGVTKDEIEVDLTDATLTVKGEKKQEVVNDEDYYRCERSFGSFTRTVELPSEVKTEVAKATSLRDLLRAADEGREPERPDCQDLSAAAAGSFRRAPALLRGDVEPSPVDASTAPEREEVWLSILLGKNVALD